MLPSSQYLIFPLRWPLSTATTTAFFPLCNTDLPLPTVSGFDEGAAGFRLPDEKQKRIPKAIITVTAVVTTGLNNSEPKMEPPEKVVRKAELQMNGAKSKQIKDDLKMNATMRKAFTKKKKKKKKYLIIENNNNKKCYLRYRNICGK